MQHKIFKTLVILSAILLASCSRVTTYVNTFSHSQIQTVSGGQKTIAVLPADKKQAASLEFDFYSTRLAKVLQSKGFKVVSSETSSDLLANIFYQVQEKEVDKPFEYNHYFGTAYDRHFGGNVIVVDQSKRIEHVRSVTVILKMNNDEQKRIYEVSGVSRGDCAVLSVVFDEMIEAMFKDFPAENGSLQKINIDGNTRC